MKEITRLTAELEKFYSELSLNYYRFGAGLQDNLPLKEIYSKYSSLFQLDTIEMVRGQLARAGDERPGFSGEQERRLTYLRGFLEDGFLSEQVKDLSEEISSLEAGERVKIHGKEYSFRYTRVLLANEEDAGERRYIAGKRQDVVRKINPLREEQITRLQELCKKLGFSSYIDAYRQINGFDFSYLAGQMEQFLDDTEGLYYQIFSSLFQDRLGLDLTEGGQQCDFSYLFRAPRFDEYFPGERAVPALKETLKGMGFDLDSQKNITLDVEERENKSPRAFCSAVKIPGEVYLVINPRGGQDDFHSLFHESGHAEHFGNVGQMAPFEFKRFGDKSVTETYAFLQQYLLTDPHWLKSRLGLDERVIAGYRQFALANKLYMLRRYAAKYLYELKLHAPGGEPLQDRSAYYAGYLTEALGAEHLAVNYLDDTDLGFYSAQYLRAWFFEVQLRQHLRQEAGEGWFEKKEAGEILHGLWSLGQKYTVDELAEKLGFPGVSTRPMVRELEGGLLPDSAG
ncbi:MAG: hypothetical protein UMV23_07310 [Halanaerobium sp.]|nr:hypothetical protein [Halanaerobium sp.]